MPDLAKTPRLPERRRPWNCDRLHCREVRMIAVSSTGIDVARNKAIHSGAIRVGCAGWSLPKEQSDRFPSEGSHLARYAVRFPAVEINSSFYKPHRPDTYSRWAESVPADFRFSVKVPKVISHERRLVDANDVLDRFLGEATELGDRLGPLLVQLPPSLSFSADIAGRFFGGSGTDTTETSPWSPGTRAGSSHQRTCSFSGIAWHESPPIRLWSRRSPSPAGGTGSSITDCTAHRRSTIRSIRMNTLKPLRSR